MFRSKVLSEIQELDPAKDHQRIVFLSCRCDFPFDTTRSLELALFRTYCSPSVSTLLDQTGEFAKRPQKRYDDTDIIVSEIMEWGYDSERGRAAMRRMNQLHGRFAIANEDLLYVLSTFVFEPIRFNARFGWRPLCEKERLAMFTFWREVGRRMDIKDLPPDYDAFEKFNREYERERFRFAPANQRVGTATRELFVSWAPRLLQPLMRPAIHALLDEEVVRCFGFPRPSRFLRGIVSGGLKLRAYLLRFLPRRRQPLLRTAMRQPTYPHGYEIEKLGPPQNGHA
jgi:hypothetical protein